MLAVAAIVIAFAQPFIPKDKNTYSENVSERIAILYIDNSFSMQVGESYHTNIEEAKKIARKISKGFSNTDRFILLTNEFHASSYRPISYQEFQKQIADIEINSRSRQFQEIISRIKDIYKQFDNTNISAFIISDFQKSFMSEHQKTDSLEFPLFFMPIEAKEVSNIGIDSIWLDSPTQLKGHIITLNAIVHNYSSEKREKVPLELYVNNSQKAISTIDLEPHQVANVEMAFTPNEFGLHNCKVVLHDSPLIYDNEFYFSFIVSENINVYILTQDGKNNTSLHKLFKNDELFVYNSDNAINRDIEKLTNANILILDGIKEISSGLMRELVNFVSEGGSLTIIPPAEMKVNLYNELVQELTLISYGDIISTGLKISKLNFQHNLFKGVFDGIPQNMDFPTIHKHYSLQIPVSSLYTPLISLQNDDVFLYQSAYQNGFVYVFTSPFDNEFTNFHRNSLFVPVFYQMSLLSTRFEKPYYTIGDRSMIEVSGIFNEQNNNFRITDKENKVSVIPEVRFSGRSNMLNTHNQLDSAGNYMLFHNDSLIAAISMNYQRLESDLHFFSNSQIDSIAKENGISAYEIMSNSNRIEVDIQEYMHGTKFWKLFLYIALSCLALEAILLRFWK